MTTISGQLVVAAKPDTEILGTLDWISGRAEIVSAEIEDGELKVDFDGTEMFWDTCLTETRGGGKTIYLDRSGTEYTADEIALKLEDGTLIPCPDKPGRPMFIGEAPAQPLDAQVRQLISDAVGLIQEAILHHIYDDGDEVPPGCGYHAFVKEAERFLAGTKGASPLERGAAIHKAILDGQDPAAAVARAAGQAIEAAHPFGYRSEDKEA